MQFQRIVTASSLAVLAVATWSSTAEAQPLRYGSPCYNGPMVGCAPRRTTWNYYETHWRRWPTDPTIGTPTPAAEPVATPTPTPADTQPAQTPPSGPSIVPEEGLPAPSPGPGTSQPRRPLRVLSQAHRCHFLMSLSRRRVLPRRVRLWRRVSRRRRFQICNRSCKRRRRTAPPTMPDDDPFKDDATQPSALPSVPSEGPALPQGSGIGHGNSETSQAGLRWRAPPKGAPPLAESAEKAPREEKTEVAHPQTQATKLSASQPANPPPQLSDVVPATTPALRASVPSAPSAALALKEEPAVVSEPEPVAISERNPLRGASRPKAMEIAEAAAKVGVAAPAESPSPADAQIAEEPATRVAELPTTAADAAPFRVPRVTPTGRNPLRLATAEPPASAVMPASWIEPAAMQPVASESLRGNPLRAN